MYNINRCFFLLAIGIVERRKHIQKCPNYKMCRDKNVWHPPLQPKRLGQISSFFGERPLMGIY